MQILIQFKTYLFWQFLHFLLLSKQDKDLKIEN
jgi:hypothetical protein